MQRILMVTDLCTCLDQPTHAHLYIGLAHTDDIWYRHTHISSSSNTRWGSLRLALVIAVCITICKA